MTTTADYLRPKQAAEFFGMSESFFRQAISARRIPSYRLGKARFIRRSEIESLIEAGLQPAVKH
jgi:excisionase family DNA binding protein